MTVRGNVRNSLYKPQLIAGVVVASHGLDNPDSGSERNSRSGKSGLKRTAYTAFGLEDRMPVQFAAVYDKRSQIKKSYEKFREARVVTTTPSATSRLFYVGVCFLLEQLWVVLQ